MALKKHGGSRTLEYGAWASMIQRCSSPTNACFHNYGGRGITVCDTWRHDFGAFIRDMGPRPTPAHTVERIDNNGPYAPHNCRWATHREQMNNVRYNRLITFENKTQTLTMWARECAIPVQTLWNRLARHLPIHLALKPGRAKRLDAGKPRRKPAHG